MLVSYQFFHGMEGLFPSGGNFIMQEGRRVRLTGILVCLIALQ
jgi:hypothetical protein